MRIIHTDNERRYLIVNKESFSYSWEVWYTLGFKSLEAIEKFLRDYKKVSRAELKTITKDMAVLTIRNSIVGIGMQETDIYTLLFIDTKTFSNEYTLLARSL